MSSSEAKLSVNEYLNKYQLQKLIEDAINHCYQTQATNPTAYMVRFFWSFWSWEKALSRFLFFFWPQQKQFFFIVNLTIFTVKQREKKLTNNFFHSYL